MTHPRPSHRACLRLRPHTTPLALQADPETESRGLEAVVDNQQPMTFERGSRRVKTSCFRLREAFRASPINRSTNGPDRAGLRGKTMAQRRRPMRPRVRLGPRPIGCRHTHCLKPEIVSDNVGREGEWWKPQVSAMRSEGIGFPGWGPGRGAGFPEGMLRVLGGIAQAPCQREPNRPERWGTTASPPRRWVHVPVPAAAGPAGRPPSGPPRG